uniref:RED-like N-terminal domain-containing protein n=1 Tax=Amphimedon queenslandica TaxID=400682 RepID=A0A1X7SYJ9_AMPQE
MSEKRKQLIANSKYLGGDIEHTHLVKGLDYALLQKVHSEMVVRDQEAEKIKNYERKKRKRRDLSVHQKKIHSIVFQANAPEKNEFFLPGRMIMIATFQSKSIPIGFVDSNF